MISIKSLNKFYNRRKSNEVHAVRNISLELPDRGMVALFGRSGCGKTTLLNLIGALDDTDGGSIALNGDNVFGKDIDRYRNAHIGYIFQNYNLNENETVFENVASALKLCGVTDKDVIREHVMNALKNVGIENYSKRLPNNLSGGQQQRVAIARAIVKNPSVILADEPTGNLDELNTVMVMEMLKELSKERLVILVTHEAHLVDYYCDRVIEIHDGLIKSEYSNNETYGYTSREKNAIYLGELDSTSVSVKGAEIQYYGEETDGEITLRIINTDGKIYITSDNPKVKFIDSSSEIKIREGVFEERKAREEKRGSFTILPLEHGRVFGKLFGFWDSLVSGVRSIHSQKKKMKLLPIMLSLSLLICMLMIYTGSILERYSGIANIAGKSVILVDGRSISSSSLKTLMENDSSIRKSSFIPSDNTLEEITKYGSSFDTVTVSVGSFESIMGYVSDLRAETRFFSLDLAKDYSLVCGKAPSLLTECLISRGTADELLSESNINYITEYEDLLGLELQINSLATNRFVISGIVDTNEFMTFLPSTFAHSENTPYFLMSQGETEYRGIDIEIDISDSEVVYVYDGLNRVKYAVGDKVLISGRQYTIADIIDAKRYSFEDYLVCEKGIRLYKTEEELISLYGQNEQYNYKKWNDLLFENSEVKPEYNMEELYDLYADEYAAYTDTFSGVNLAGGFILSDDDYKLAISWTNEYVGSYSIDYSKPDFYGVFILYSENVKNTANALKEIDANYVTPAKMRDILMADFISEFITSITIVGVILVFLMVSIYFMMRSIMLSRIREVGIYRAIGVSKKNILFRFFVEISYTVAVAIILPMIVFSAFIYIVMGTTSIVTLYFPIWLVLIYIAATYGVCTVAGIIPIFTLLSKTPSEILAKYDI